MEVTRQIIFIISGRTKWRNTKCWRERDRRESGRLSHLSLFTISSLTRFFPSSPSSESVQPVCLPSTGLNVEEFLGSRDAVVAGWGSTEVAISSDILQAAKIPFANKTVCEPHYRGQLVDEQVSRRGHEDLGVCYCSWT